MPLNFKLVGFIINKKYYEIKYVFEGNINLSIIHKIFIVWGLTQDEVDQIKFIIDSEQINDPTKLYPINHDEINTIYIFIFNQVIKQKLQLIFIDHGVPVANSDEQHNEPITQVESDPLPILTPDIINKMNEETLILFSDPDFINILSIYKRKPELFNLLSNYIQVSEIKTDLLLPEKKIEELTSEEKTYYTEMSLKIMNLNLSVSQEEIIMKLIKYSGHLNLTIRSLFN
jgi:hypothetical protein